jgi:hypothetical protein
MFKWVWLIILLLFWLVWFCVSMKDVVITIIWCIKNRESDFYNRFEENTYVFFAATITVLFFASLIYFVWSV